MAEEGALEAYSSHIKKNRKEIGRILKFSVPIFLFVFMEEPTIVSIALEMHRTYFFALYACLTTTGN